MPEKKRTFEESLNRVEEIVRLLEKGDIALQESLSLFEEGSALLADCDQMLDSAEQRVMLLQKGENGETEEVPFE